MRRHRVKAGGMAQVTGIVLAGAFSATAAGQIVAIDEFEGEFREGFESAACCQQTPCVEPEVFGGQATLCSDIAHVSGNWGFKCVMQSFAGERHFGSMEGAAVYRFARPVRRFGAQIGTNALEPGEPTDGGRVEFYDERGDLIGSQPLNLHERCGWRWHGWQSDEPVGRIVVRGASAAGGEAFVMMDEVRFDLWEGGGGGCYADCDDSGELDFFDFLCFQNAFSAGETKADCDESGSTSLTSCASRTRSAPGAGSARRRGRAGARRKS